MRISRAGCHSRRPAGRASCTLTGAGAGERASSVGQASLMHAPRPARMGICARDSVRGCGDQLRCRGSSAVPRSGKCPDPRSQPTPRSAATSSRAPTQPPDRIFHMHQL